MRTPLEARARIAALEANIRTLEHNAQTRGANRADGYFDGDTRSKRKLGRHIGNSGTSQGREDLAEMCRRIELEKRRPLIEKYRRKIARIRKHFHLPANDGENDG